MSTRILILVGKDKIDFICAAIAAETMAAAGVKIAVLAEVPHAKQFLPRLRRAFSTVPIVATYPSPDPTKLGICKLVATKEEQKQAKTVLCDAGDYDNAVSLLQFIKT